MNGGGQHHHHQQQQQRANRTEDAHIEVDITLEELYKGKVIKTTSTRNIICTQCKGLGVKSSSVVSKQCVTCHGEGSVRKIKRVGPGLVAQEYAECTTCQGTGKIYRTKDKCKLCKGTRIIEETKILEFEIPKGSPDHGMIAKKGESDQYPGKTAGDVILEYKCKPHDVFERQGDDLYTKIDIPLVDALCGFSKLVAVHLDGRGIKIETPTGKVVRPGDYIKLAGEGMPKSDNKKSWFSSSGKGDLYVEVNIEFPKDNWFMEKMISQRSRIFYQVQQNKTNIMYQKQAWNCSPIFQLSKLINYLTTQMKRKPIMMDTTKLVHNHLVLNSKKNKRK